jgi:hypothetical protein
LVKTDSKPLIQFTKLIRKYENLVIRIEKNYPLEAEEFPLSPKAEEEESLVFNRKESWEFGTSLGFLACITTVRDSLRARHDLGVAGSVSLDFFTCPLAPPIWS